VLNVLTDLYLLSIPIPMLWQANLRPTRKAGLILLFSCGLFVTMAGILRCVLILTVSQAEDLREKYCLTESSRTRSTVLSKPDPGPAGKPSWPLSLPIYL
jgi:hypothetical protein